ncbi:copper resistance CopC family protein [Intrasporangium sp. DVR]|uniref:copper resistance CopC family protein n=1 Tax=Intrasporangium sp. DVR TaxID=3127867 RepID=UPI00313A5234
MRRFVLVLLALGAAFGVTTRLLVGTPPTAFAHDVLEKTTPGEGTTVARLPAEVVLVFSQEPLEIGLQVIITGPTGNVAQGAAVIEGREVRQALSSAAAAGDYTVAYRVTSQDGHPLTGSFRFFATTGLDGSTATTGPSVAVAAPADPEAESAKDSQLVPVLLTAAGTVIALALIAYVMVKLRRRGA